MESATKNKQSNEAVIHMVQKAFGAGSNSEQIKIRELTEGYFNVAYEIGFAGQEVILKIAPPPSASVMSYEKNLMRAEVEGLRLVKNQTAVPVPEVLLYDTSKTLCSSDYFFMEKLYGESFYKMRCSEMPQQEQDHILMETGRLNKEMNRITGSRFGYIGQPGIQGLNWREIFLSMISDILSDGERVGISLGIGYETVRNLIHNAAPALDEVTQPVFVHWDLWDGNIFVKDRKVSGIIDFERALWGDPLMEYFFRRHAYNDKFTLGYGSDLRTMAPVRALLYDIYLYLILVIETEYRKYPDDGQYHFAVKELNTAAEALNRLL